MDFEFIVKRFCSSGFSALSIRIDSPMLQYMIGTPYCLIAAERRPYQRKADSIETFNFICVLCKYSRRMYFKRMNRSVAF